MSNDSNRWDVMSIREYTTATGEQKTQWTKIGVAFTNKNGSINVVLDAFPVDGKMQLQVPLTREEREAMFNAKQGGAQRRGGGDNYGQPPPQQQQRGGFGGQQRSQNPRNAGQQQRQQAQQRFGQRGQSQPQSFPQQHSAPHYEPDPDVAHGEAGWDVGGVWITDARDLPKDHPDHIPF